MAKSSKSIFFCQNCGHESAKWMGQCPACRAWNSFAEEVIRAPKPGQSISAAAKRAKDAPVPQKLADITLDETNRICTGIGEFDRVLGGGIVSGSLTLIGGDPGIGKSTLLLQMCRQLSGRPRGILYVSGEESLRQIKMRAERIGTFQDGLKLLCETNLDLIEQIIAQEMPGAVVIDSIQTMYNEAVSSSPGSVSQVCESTGVLLRIAKGMQIPVFIVGHVTKDGSVAGPRVLEHMVDTVLYFEGDRNASYRILRAVKNRFGSTNEIGVFEMRSEGLTEVANPSEFMLEGRAEHASGSVVSCSMEGSRPIMLEVQALACQTNFGFPRRTANGTDFNRVNLLVAVLERRARINLSQRDVYVNIAGGTKMTEPAVDLGILLAIVSSEKDLPVDSKTVVFGEVGLSGEIRSVSMAQQRVNEAEKLGFDTVILPKANMRNVTLPPGSSVKLVPVDSVADAIRALRGR